MARAFSERHREQLIKFFGLLGSANANEANSARVKIDALLRQTEKSWTDLPDLLSRGLAIKADLASQVSELGSQAFDTREAAYRNIMDLLARHAKTWNDLTEFLCAPSSPSWADDFSYPGLASSSSKTNTPPNPLDLVHRLLEQHVALKPHEYDAVALWILQTHVYRRFTITPRLVLISPVSGCDETTLLSIIDKLVARPAKSDWISWAAIYHLVDHDHPTLLLNEVDNHDLANGRLRIIFKSGYRHDGVIANMDDGHCRGYSTFAPLAAAVTGSEAWLPPFVRQLSIVIGMTRKGGERVLRRFDPQDPALEIVRREASSWARTISLDLKPEMPIELRNCFRDNWEPLLAIADACGWGARAREAAVAFAKGHQEEDVGVLLLRDIRTIFNVRGIERLPSVTLVAALNALDDAMWCEWRGLRGNKLPHPLSQGDLARMLGSFGIRSQTIWPLNRGIGDKSCKGYLRGQFEYAWRSYCADEDSGPTSQNSNVKHLRQT